MVRLGKFDLRAAASALGIAAACFATAVPADEVPSVPKPLSRAIYEVSTDELSQLPKPNWLLGKLDSSPAFKRTSLYCNGDVFVRIWLARRPWDNEGFAVHKHGDYFSAALSRDSKQLQALRLTKSESDYLRTLLLLANRGSQRGNIAVGVAMLTGAVYFSSAVADAEFLQAVLDASPVLHSLITNKNLGKFVVGAISLVSATSYVKTNEFYKTMETQIRNAAPDDAWLLRFASPVVSNDKMEFIRLAYFVYDGDRAFLPLSVCYYASEAPMTNP